MFQLAGEMACGQLGLLGDGNAQRIAPPFKETKETKSYAATVSFASLSPLSPSELSRQNAKKLAQPRPACLIRRRTRFEFRSSLAYPIPITCPLFCDPSRFNHPFLTARGRASMSGPRWFAPAYNEVHLCRT